MTGLLCMLGHKISHIHLWMFLWMPTLIMKAEKAKILSSTTVPTGVRFPKMGSMGGEEGLGWEKQAEFNFVRVMPESRT